MTHQIYLFVSPDLDAVVAFLLNFTFELLYDILQIVCVVLAFLSGFEEKLPLFVEFLGQLVLKSHLLIKTFQEAVSQSFDVRHKHFMRILTFLIGVVTCYALIFLCVFGRSSLAALLRAGILLSGAFTLLILLFLECGLVLFLAINKYGIKENVVEVIDVRFDAGESGLNSSNLRGAFIFLCVDKVIL